MLPGAGPPELAAAPAEPLRAVRRLGGYPRHRHHGLRRLRALLCAGEPAENRHPHRGPGTSPGARWAEAAWIRAFSQAVGPLRGQASPRLRAWSCGSWWFRLASARSAPGSCPLPACGPALSLPPRWPRWDTPAITRADEAQRPGSRPTSTGLMSTQDSSSAQGGSIGGPGEPSPADPSAHAMAVQPFSAFLGRSGELGTDQSPLGHRPHSRYG